MQIKMRQRIDLFLCRFFIIFYGAGVDIFLKIICFFPQLGRTETIETVPAKYQELAFQKLFGYYGSKGIVLNQKTFIKNLGLKTKEGEFNILAQLLSDNSHFPLRVSIFDGETKGSNLFFCT